MRKAGVLVVLLLGIIGIFVFYQYNRNHESLGAIKSFKDCSEAGFPVMESYPPRCTIPDGRSFTQDIGNELEYSDEILVDAPRPNQKFASGSSVKGKARGIWFFEGSFSGELFDAKRNSLGTVILQAKGDWMTSDFVPFAGNLTFSTPGTATGTLVLKKDNPSGLPENDKKLSIPVTF